MTIINYNTPRHHVREDSHLEFSAKCPGVDLKIILYVKKLKEDWQVDATVKAQLDDGSPKEIKKVKILKSEQGFWLGAWDTVYLRPVYTNLAGGKDQLDDYENFKTSPETLIASELKEFGNQPLIEITAQDDLLSIESDWLQEILFKPLNTNKISTSFPLEIKRQISTSSKIPIGHTSKNSHPTATSSIKTMGKEEGKQLKQQPFSKKKLQSSKGGISEKKIDNSHLASNPYKKEPDEYKQSTPKSSPTTSLNVKAPLRRSFKSY